MERPTLDEYYLGIAKAVAARSTCLRKQHGAIIVNNGEIVSTGYNNPPRGEPHCETCTKNCTGRNASAYLECPSVHAEQNAIISASRNEMIGSTLYLYGWDVINQKPAENVWPCEICLRLIKNAGISRVVSSTGAEYTRDSNNILIRVK